jgi:hypothetical protein
VRRALNGHKAMRTFELLGYTASDLIACLERQFLPGMGWHNMSEWHIDHVVPLASFNIASETCQEFKSAWSLGNLRPIWKAQNLRKGADRDFLL